MNIYIYIHIYIYICVYINIYIYMYIWFFSSDRFPQYPIVSPQRLQLGHHVAQVPPQASSQSWSLVPLNSGRWRCSTTPWGELLERIYPLVIEQFAIENGPFIVDLPIENGDFPYLCYFTRGVIH